ncbi:MAG: hypothetical protein V4677_00675 [Bacteroidota bacterium]
MKIKITFLLLSFFCFTKLIYAQEKAIIVNTEGRIIKSFGENNKTSFSIPDNYNSENILVIEHIEAADSEKYILIYQIRNNDYLYRSNIVAINDSIIWGNFYNNSLYFKLPEIESGKILSYQLLKTNDWGKTKKNFTEMMHSSNWKKHYLKAIDIDAEYTKFIKNKIQFISFSGSMNYIAAKNKYEELKEQSEKNEKNDSVKLLNKQQQLLSYELAHYDGKLSKLAGMPRTDGVIKSIDSASAITVRTKKYLLDNIEMIEQFKARDDEKLEQAKKTYEESKKKLNIPDMQKEFLKQNDKLSFIEDPVVTSLRQGIIIGTSDQVKEIEYDFYDITLDGTDQKSVVIQRQTPNLPQLTTDDQLFIRVMNVTKNNLEYPFFIQLATDVTKTVTATSLENGPIIKTMDDIGNFLPDLDFSFSDLLGTNTLSLSPSNSALEKAGSEDTIMLNGISYEESRVLALVQEINAKPNPDDNTLLDLYKRSKELRDATYIKKLFKSEPEKIKSVIASIIKLDSLIKAKVLHWANNPDNDPKKQTETGLYFVNFNLNELGFTKDETELIGIAFYRAGINYILLYKLNNWAIQMNQLNVSVNDTSTVRHYQNLVDSLTDYMDEENSLESWNAIKAGFATHTIIKDITTASAKQASDLKGIKAYINSWPERYKSITAGGAFKEYVLLLFYKNIGLDLTQTEEKSIAEVIEKLNKDCLISIVEEAEKIVTSSEITLADMNSTTDNYYMILSSINEDDVPKDQYKKIKKVLQKVEIQRNLTETIGKLVVKELTIPDPGDTQYFDYIVKYEKEFPYLSTPVIMIKADMPTFQSNTITMADGTVKRDYVISKGVDTFATDQLPAIRKRYLFSVNAGVIATQITSYNYSQELISGSQTAYYLNEKKSVDTKYLPTVFFSMYLGANDIYEKINSRNWYHKLHIDVGIDYGDTKFLDNVYAGIGFEPFRSFHIVGGCRFGQVPKVDMSQVNAVSLDISNAQSNVFIYAPYFGINLGFNLIPTAIKSLLNKL